MSKTSTSSQKTASRSAAVVLGRSALTGRPVLKPFPKPTTVSAKAIRAAIAAARAESDTLPPKETKRAKAK